METKEENSTNEKQAGGFFQNLISSLFTSHSPEAVKKRQLKTIAKDFSKTKFHSFYKASSGEILPPFAKLFYDVYKIIYPAQNYIKSIQNPNAYKSQVFNYSLSEQQATLLSQLSEENITEKSKKIPLKELKALVNDSLEKFSAGFDTERILKTDNLYRAYLSFIDFCTFDYFFMLKKFTNAIQEGNFTAAPTFDKINAEYILDDLQDLISVLYSIPEDINWDSFFAMIKATRGGDLVPPGTWKKIIARMKSIQASRSLEMIVKLIKKDPSFTPKVLSHNETITEDFIEKNRNETLEAMANLESQQKASKTNSIALQIFGETDIDLLKNYSKANSSMLEKKELNYYTYAESLNYLKEFLLNHVKTDLRTYSDIVVIRGQWDATLSAPFSNGYQELLATSDAITEFDDSLSEEGTVGIKIKTLLPKIAHDPGAENIINRLVSDANEMARGFIMKSTQNLITIGKLIKQLIEDEKLSKPNLVANWKDLERFSEKPLLEFGIDIYKRIYLFVQLMQTCLTNESEN